MGHHLLMTSLVVGDNVARSVVFDMGIGWKDTLMLQSVRAGGILSMYIYVYICVVDDCRVNVDV